MSWFDASIEFSEQTEQFRRVLERIEFEMRDNYELLVQLSDEVMTAIGVDAFEQAQEIPVDPDTLLRVAPRKRRRRRRRRRRPTNRWGVLAGKTRSQEYATTSRPFPERGPYSVEAALTTPHLQRSGQSVALRQIQANSTILWGTKRWIDFLHPHIDGTSRGLPARLSLLQPRRWEPEAAERTKDVLAGYVGAKLEAAGAPVSWIQEILEERF